MLLPILTGYSDMKCNLPKSWDQLPPREKELINKTMTEWAYDIVEKEQANLQEIWIKLACILLHDFHGFDEDELLKFIAAWKRIYRRNDRTGDKETHDAWLEEEMQKCFPSCGFPQIRIDELKERN